MEIETNRDSVCITYIAKSMNNVLLKISTCLPDGCMFSFSICRYMGSIGNFSEKALFRALDGFSLKEQRYGK